MYKGFYNLTSAMLTHGKHLDVISNNMTNVSTAGYKADRFTGSTFQEVLWNLVGNREKNYMDLGMQSWITAPSQLYTDFTQGSFDVTGQPLDFGIEGQGYFAVQTDNGRVYTRSGNFSLDDEGYLCLPGQGRVLSVTGNPIQLVTDRLTSDGLGGLYNEDGGFLGRIAVFDFVGNEGLEKNDQALFTAANEGTRTNVTVRQGLLERSNVDMVKELTEMISTERAYQSAAEVIKIYDNVIQSATTDVGRLA